MDASDLGLLNSLLAAEVRFRCATTGRGRTRKGEVEQLCATNILRELGLDEIKIGRQLYTLRRRIAARAKLDGIASFPRETK